MSRWREFSRRRNKTYAKTVRIGLVAKYVGNNDTYMCVTEALKAAAAWNSVNLDLVWLSAEEYTPKDLRAIHGLVVPGGFGPRGVEGKIAAATYALKNNVPYLGLCLGMQAAVIAAARLGGIKTANSEEFGASNKARNNVVYLMPEQKGKESTGGTMRLGSYPAILVQGSRTAKIYGATQISERHRHRYEVNQSFLPEIAQGGLLVSGTSPDGKLVEFVEAQNHPFFIATQAHPEFKSRPLAPHPLFLEFIKACKTTSNH